LASLRLGRKNSDSPEFQIDDINLPLTSIVVLGI
jgi:hypothetical protein